MNYSTLVSPEALSWWSFLHFTTPLDSILFSCSLVRSYRSCSTTTLAHIACVSGCTCHLSSSSSTNFCSCTLYRYCAGCTGLWSTSRRNLHLCFDILSRSLRVKMRGKRQILVGIKKCHSQLKMKSVCETTRNATLFLITKKKITRNTLVPIGC